MRKVELAEATGPLSEYAKKAAKETVVVTRRGRPLAAVVPVDPDEWEDFAVSQHPDSRRSVPQHLPDLTFHLGGEAPEGQAVGEAAARRLAPPEVALEREGAARASSPSPTLRPAGEASALSPDRQRRVRRLASVLGGGPLDIEQTIEFSARQRFGEGRCLWEGLSWAHAVPLDGPSVARRRG